MTSDIQITTVPAQHALVVAKRASTTTIGEQMGEAFGQLTQHAAATGAQIVGPPFSVYLEMPGEDFAFLSGVPVAAGATAGDGVEVQQLPGGEAAVLTYRGSYDGLSEQWQRLMTWVASSGRTPGAPPREVYLNEPGVVAPEELLTQLVMPLA